MATLDELREKLAKLQDSLSGIHALTERLAHVHDADVDADADVDILDEDEDCGDDDDSTTADLVADIADGLNDAEDDHELLLEDAADLALPVSKAPAAAAAAAATADAAAAADRAQIQDSLASTKREIERLHAAFRAARLQARNGRDAARCIRHQRLLATYAAAAMATSDDEASDDEAAAAPVDQDVRSALATRVPHRRHPPPQPRSKAATAAADVTAALRQTHARIAGEVARSEFAAQTLAESSRALEELGHRYTGGGGGGSSGSSPSSVRGSLVAARGLVRNLVAAHKSDTWYLQTALLLVASTIIWLLFRRLLYGPLWLLVWWPLRTSAGGVSGLASAAGWLGSNRAGAVITTTTTTTIATSPIAVVQATPATSSGSGAGGHSNTPTDSVVEQVGQIVDEAGSSSGSRGADSGGNAGNAGNAAPVADPQDDRPNPMKRMWQEDVEAAKYEEQQAQERKEQEEQQRKKDEL